MGVLYSCKGRSKKDSSGSFSGKARRDTRSVATGIPFQRGFGKVKKSADADCGSLMMRRSCLAMKNGCWDDFKERYRKEEKSSEWTLERVREACEKVAKDEVGRVGIVQGLLRKNTDFLRRVIAPVDGMGGVTLSYVGQFCNSFPLEDYTTWVSTGRGDGNNRQEALQLMVCGLWRIIRRERPIEYWWCRMVPMPMKRRCLKRTQCAQVAGEPAERW